MQFRTREIVVAVGVALCGLSAPALAQLPPPPPPPATLWSFLGIPQAFRSMRDGRSNRSGNNPDAERKPPLKAIADPKNLESPDPAIKKAAEVKQAEDLKQQKIKAVKYLASIGCGCYNRDGSITDALLKSMDDCTEDVRLATVRAIAVAAAGEQCANCKQRSCCSEEISNKLYEIAYEKDDTGCFLEPSERVRLSAAEALRTCCPGSDEDFFVEMGPPPARLPDGGERPSVAPPSGGERPATIPTLPPVPTPAIPLQGVPLPPAPVLPPGAIPRPPAPAAGTAPAPRSSRRTAALQAAPPQVAANDVATNENESLTRVVPLRLDAPSPTPHWSPEKSQQTVLFQTPARGSSANVETNEAPTQTGNAVVRIAGHATSAPLVSNASLTRLPPIDGPASEAVPSPPLPPAATQATPVSTRRPPLPSVKRADSAKSDAASSKRAKPAIPVAQRVIPGAQFGTGVVTSVRVKDGLAMLEFTGDASVPPGSVVRTYHEYALTGKTAVCDLEVVRGEGGLAAAVARPGSELTDLSVGDQAIVLR